VRFFVGKEFPLKKVLFVILVSGFALTTIMNACDTTEKVVKRGADKGGPGDGTLGSGDSDGDGLTDDREAQLGTDPKKPDTDDDGLLDGAEVNTHGTDPKKKDTDGGGINDGLEVGRGTDPKIGRDDLTGDADNDGLDDEEEIRRGTDPNFPDSDRDGLTDGAEVNTYDTNPKDPDTDDGGVDDGMEVAAGTNPRNKPNDDYLPMNDSDKDGLTDQEEERVGTDKTRADTDGDGLRDGEEVKTLGTNPKVRDTDKGGVIDGVEVNRGLNPLDPLDDRRRAMDSDGDGLTDVQEIALGTDPNKPDTDEDGLSDGAEVLTYKTDPKNKDTDGGGVNDGDEVNCGTDPNDGEDDILYRLEVRLLQKPPLTTTSNEATFEFAVESSGRLATVKCYLDGVEVPGGCQARTPLTLRGLPYGSRTFKVQAQNDLGQTATAHYAWQIEKIRGTCDEAQVVEKTLVFEPTSKTCEFSVGENLSPKDAFIRARRVQNQQVILPANVEICDVEFKAKAKKLWFDDHIVMTWNSTVMFTSADFLGLETKSLGRTFDFLSVRDTNLFRTEIPYCFGEDLGTICKVPGHDVARELNVELSEGARQQMKNFLNQTLGRTPADSDVSAAPAVVNVQVHNFFLSVVGDNDRSDCQHSGVTADVKIKYRFPSEIHIHQPAPAQ
jgi:hypothetical protein